jgi:hypothetical protein
MVTFKSIYQFSFYFAFATIFLFGGALQFFFGISNTGLTLLLCGLFYFNYFLYVLINENKVLINRIILVALFYIFLIIGSGLINRSHPVNLVLYNIFPLLPLGTYLFFYVNRNKNYINYHKALIVILFVASIQLPILLIQRFFYDFLILFNYSGQQIASFDFLFGSFFLKSDHSLGFFLLSCIIIIAFNIGNVKSNIKNPLIFIIYFSITLLLAESNISKALLLLLLAYLVIVSFYSSLIKIKVIRRITLAIVFIGVLALLYNLRNIDVITSKVGGTFERHFTVEKSYRFFLEGTAKREQVVIAAINSIDTKFIGDGPYSYFDIRTGKFRNTIHFSQLIWTYFDLGLLGLITIFFYIYNIVRVLNISNKWFFLYIFSIISIYSFYTTPFSEIGIVFSIFLFFYLIKTK